MKVSVLFFGATAVAAGRRKVDLDLPDLTPSSLAFEKVIERFPSLGAHKLLFSVERSYATGTEILQNGDEIAIFTAVSGG